MIIGLDLDNTIINYERSFLLNAKKIKLIPSNFEGTKKDIKRIIINKRNLIESFFSGVLFHGLYLGGVFYEVHGNFDYAWYASIALSIFAGVIHLPIKEKPIERPQIA